jgi:hypothetical protein
MQPFLVHQQVIDDGVNDGKNGVLTLIGSARSFYHVEKIALAIADRIFDKTAARSMPMTILFLLSSCENPVSESTDHHS